MDSTQKREYSAGNRLPEVKVRTNAWSSDGEDVVDEPDEDPGPAVSSFTNIVAAPVGFLYVPRALRSCINETLCHPACVTLENLETTINVTCFKFFHDESTSTRRGVRSRLQPFLTFTSSV